MDAMYIYARDYQLLGLTQLLSNDAVIYPMGEDLIQAEFSIASEVYLTCLCHSITPPELGLSWVRLGFFGWWKPPFSSSESM